MFLIDDITTTNVRVKFDVPAKGTTTPGKADFVAVFKVVNEETFRERQKTAADHNLKTTMELKKAVEKGQDPQYERKDYDEQFCREDLVGLEGIKGEKGGDDLPFNDELVDQVFSNRYSRAALIRAWLDLNASPEKAFRKN